MFKFCPSLSSVLVEEITKIQGEVYVLVTKIKNISNEDDWLRQYFCLFVQLFDFYSLNLSTIE